VTVETSEPKVSHRLEEVADLLALGVKRAQLREVRTGKQGESSTGLGAEMERVLGPENAS
jgi:hypothetical protein